MLKQVLTVSSLLEIIHWRVRSREMEESRLNPEDFCKAWITKLYGIEPGTDLYRKACVQEFTRYLDVKKSSAYTNWVWTGPKEHYYPKYLPAFLWLLDQRYSIMEKLGCLPRYTIERDNDWE